MRTARVVTALVVLVLARAAPVLAARSDAWITTTTKIALLTSEGMAGADVNVDTVDGRVTLHGKVPSEKAKRRAEEVARGVSGVRDVRNLLQVVPAARQEQVAASDDELEERVEQALDADPQLADSDIDVESVNGGVVLIEGTAKTLTDQLHAIEVATRVPGVRRVASQVTGPDTLADDALWAEGEEDDTATARGGGPSDLWITSATKLRLLADERTPALDINVDTNDGVVTLFGIVPSEAAKRAAEENARKVAGVREVRNQLQVVPSEQQKAVAARDDEIEQNVRRALEAREDLRDAEIGVEVRNGVARLTGTVPSNEQRLRAAVVARSATGVRSVEDDLRVARQGDTGAGGTRTEQPGPGTSRTGEPRTGD